MQFDFIAPYYDTISRMVFGSAMVMAKISLFGNIASGSRILIIGGGSGSSLTSLLHSKDNLKIDFVDPSQRMISIAKNRVQDSLNVSFYQLPIEQFEGDVYDFIITEFFFDLFDQAKINELIDIISLKLNENGKWIDTDFRDSSKFRNRIILKLMFQFFKITANIISSKLVYTKPLFINAGFEIINEHKFNSGFISSQLIARP